MEKKTKVKTKLNKNEILKLYAQYFEKVKRTLLKSCYYRQYEHLIDVDDATQIIDLSFINAVQTYDESTNKYSFFNYFFFLAKVKLLDTYRKYKYNNKKVLLNSLSDNNVSSFMINKNNYVDFNEGLYNKERELEHTLKIKFLKLYFHHSIKNELNKKIFYYKMKHYSSKEISVLVKIDEKEVRYRWNNLRSRIKVSYLKWIQNLQHQ